MSLSGNLEDVSVADVLQFINLGGRSGTLALACGDGRGEIGFHRGRIIYAQGPHSKRLGELLVERGELARHDLEGALRIQKRMACPSALGQILIEMGVLTPERMKDVFERSVEDTVYELVTWTRGSFDFAVDELKPIDDLSLSPGDILPDIHINTQMVLLEASRIVDERGQRGSGKLSAAPPVPVISDKPDPSHTVATASSEWRLLDSPLASGAQSQNIAPLATQEPARANEATRLRIQVVSGDRALVEEIDRLLSMKDTVVVQVSARDAGTRLPGEISPVVIVDLRQDGVDARTLGSIHRTRPGAAIVAVADQNECVCGENYLAGALALVPAEASVIVACLRNVLRVRSSVDEARLTHDQLKESAAKLRRVFGEFRSGLVTATISLNLMNLVSESVERAMLFVVAKTDLLVLGAFGRTPTGEPLAQRARGFRVKLDSAGALADSLRDARAQTLTYEEAQIPDELTALIGRPATGQCAILPLLGSRKVIATLYADNGAKNRPIEDIEFLDMATSQVAMFYENELLRRQKGTLGHH